MLHKLMCDNEQVVAYNIELIQQYIEGMRMRAVIAVALGGGT